MNRPSILLADEPTGNLDPTTSIGIMRLLDRINRTGTTILMATHDDEIVDQMRKRVVEPGGRARGARPGPRRLRLAALTTERRQGTPGTCDCSSSSATCSTGCAATCR
ncbi:hypothetical protein GCM10025868_12130 [Angustibacter aerolatus]|uniref:Cell division ATP-binding protein FtsE n=1 Tax=Angustibacter aerolatus TaxID=1162965 RepID=A0ABQ6JCS0_9ACTN|nr:hypothetical protein GCM10025868_12130 [Angustibacter aerolatus]